MHRLQMGCTVLNMGNSKADSKSDASQVHLKVRKDGSVLIPAVFRKALGMKPGEPLVASWVDHEVRIMTLKHRLEEAQRHARKNIKPGVSLVDELIADRRREAQRE